MKSKKEIFREIVDKNDGWANGETVYEAMDEYAKQEAIEFADWIYRNGDLLYAQIMHEKKTTDQLYNLYQESKKTKCG